MVFVAGMPGTEVRCGNPSILTADLISLELSEYTHRKYVVPRNSWMGLWVSSADFDFIFTWPGGRAVQWRFGISPDDSGEIDLAPRRIAPFHGTASWDNGVDVALTYSSPKFALEGDELLKGAAPTLMDPQSDERMRRPTLWADLASRIINFLDRQPGW
jgi:hypothetical protein